MPIQNGFDSFSRANQTGWGTASDGQTYTQARGNQTLSISSNEGVMTYNGSNTTGVMTMGSTKVGDGEYLVRCTQTSTSDIMGICPRFKDSNNFYSFVQGATAGQFQLRLDNAGTFSTIAGVAFTTTTGTYYWIRCRIIGGNNFFGKIWQDGTSEPNTWQIGALGVTDSTIAGPQSFGLVGTPASSGNTVKFDNFYAFDYINSDDLTASDLLLLTGGASAEYNPTDSLTASDLAGLIAWNVDSLTANESTTFTDTSLSIDALPISDLLTQQREGAYTENNIISDNLQQTDIAIPIDALTVNENILYANAALPADNLSVSDFQSATGNVLPTNNISIAEIMLSSDLGNYIDMLSVNDTPGFTDGETLIELYNISDMGALQIWPVDNLNVSDIASYASGSGLLDGLPIVSVPLETIIYLSMDQLSSLDSFVATSSTPQPIELSYITVYGARGTITITGYRGTITAHGARGTIMVKGE